MSFKFKNCVIKQFHVHSCHADGDWKRKAFRRSPAMSRMRSNSPEIRQASPPMPKKRSESSKSREIRKRSNSSESREASPGRSRKRPRPSCHQGNSDSKFRIGADKIIVMDQPHVCVQGLAAPASPDIPWEWERRGCRFLEEDLQRSTCDTVSKGGPQPMTPEGLLARGKPWCNSLS